MVEKSRRRRTHPFYAKVVKGSSPDPVVSLGEVDKACCLRQKGVRWKGGETLNLYFSEK
jgi:hypothetical protein